MRNAHRHARAAMGVLLEADGHEVWGWRGRTLSQRVSTPEGSAWLRLACVSADQTNMTFWNGTLEADKILPASVPRPRLRTVYDWAPASWRYRAELYDHVTAQIASATAVLRSAPHLPSAWWEALEVVLADIAPIETNRVTTGQAYLDSAMPRFLGTPIDSTVRSWATAHGDLHFANLCAPDLCVLDWEGWGLAPTGYDAAVLHCYSLLVPAVAARIRDWLAHLLDTPDGRFAELAVITELLQFNASGGNLDLAGPLRDRAAHLLGRAIPHLDDQVAG
ncbi:aminoglycoside phosphotransferase [Sinosporangium album]|nr:aminoglycoside phosphotransferase [Sinosporangium album]